MPFQTSGRRVSSPAAVFIGRIAMHEAIKGAQLYSIIFAGDVYGSTVHTNNEGITSQIAAPPAAAAAAGRGAVEGGGAAAAGQLPARRLTHAERLGNAKASMLKLLSGTSSIYANGE